MTTTERWLQQTRAVERLSRDVDDRARRVKLEQDGLRDARELLSGARKDLQATEAAMRSATARARRAGKEPAFGIH